MQKSGVATCVLLLVVILLAEVAMAAYKKPPFNGSIFGKRGSVVEYDAAGRALSAMCEIASEACSAWFSQSENKEGAGQKLLFGAAEEQRELRSRT